MDNNTKTRDGQCHGKEMKSSESNERADSLTSPEQPQPTVTTPPSGGRCAAGTPPTTVVCYCHS